MAQMYDFTIIGGGILGTSLSYFLSSFTENKQILVIEQEKNVAQHTSKRNTGKVHAPFLYDPQKKTLFAKTAFLGYDMWKNYARIKNLPFKQDGVLEVATDEKGIDRLEKYHKWGIENGLDESELTILDKSEVTKLEPHVRCQKAICCTRDGSVNYAVFTESLKTDSQKNGTKFLFDNKVSSITKKEDYLEIKTTKNNLIKTKFLINASGGEAIDIAHKMNIAKSLTDIHFRGEYWKAKPEYYNITKMSIYSVPKNTDYPFLDPHWIVRVDGQVEVGPNAVPVFSPYGYTWSENTKKLFPKLYEMMNSGAKKILFDKNFQSLASHEFLSSVSKKVMINRVQEFLPIIKSSWFEQKGTAGIRSSVINEKGSFVPDMLLEEGPMSLHIINYNSPGATGALPVSILILKQLFDKGIVAYNGVNNYKIWNYNDISQNFDNLQINNLTMKT